jgi:hypothetical protein
MSRTVEGTVIYVLSASMETTEDDFEKGEIGRTRLVWEEGTTGPYRDFAALLAHFSSVPGAPTERAAWVVYGDEKGRIEASWTVDDENSSASKSEIEKWKQGKLKLWAARLNVRIAVAAQQIPTAEWIAKASGFEVV